jgi:hypothetical protein
MQLVDDASLLWASPTSQGTPDLSLLPAGTSLIVSFDPSLWSKLDPGGGLAPELQQGLGRLEASLGTSWDNVDYLTLAVQPAGDGNVRYSAVVTLKEPLEVAAFISQNKIELAKTDDGKSIYVGESEEQAAYYFPQGSTTTQISKYAVGYLDAIRDIASNDGAPIVLPRNLAALWQGIGDRPSFALLAAPNFFFADGRSMLEQFAPQWREPFKRLLVPDASGVMLRMEYRDSWYGELRLSPGGSVTSLALQTKVRELFASLPNAAEQFLVQASPHPSWRLLAIRFPAMVRALQSMTRTGVVDGNVHANFYLPKEAAPNLLLASWLASNTSAGPATASPTAVTPSNALTTLEQLIQHKFSIRFGQESLEMAGESIRDQFNASLPAGSLPLEIVLLGGDLELDGITQNQQIRDFFHEDQTLSFVLDDLVRRANPDRTATELSQVAQKLVWVIGTDPNNPDKQVVLITTRTQANEKKYTLPTQFVPPQN